MNQILNFLLQPQIAFAQSKPVSDAATEASSGTVSQIAVALTSFLTMIPLWIAGFLIIVVSFLVARIVKSSVENKMSERGLDEEHKEVQIVAARSANAAVIVLGTTVGLKVAGLDLTPIIAAVAFGAGFAFQDIIKNFFAGLVILASRHYTIGDIIKVGNTTGRIEAIQTRATILKAFDGTRIVVPNANLFTDQVISKTSNPTRRLTFTMGCGYDDDLKEVAKVTLATLKSIPEILVNPKPKVTFFQWNDWEILFKISVWVESKGSNKRKVKNKLIMQLTQAYNDADFDMPYPIQTNQLTNLYNSPEKLNSSIDRMKTNRGGNFYPKKEQEDTSAVPFQAQFSGEDFQERTMPTSADPRASTAPLAPVAPNPLATINSDATSWLKTALTQYQQPVPPKGGTLEVEPVIMTEGYVDGTDAFSFPPSPSSQPGLSISKNT